ncbi:Two-component sensor histidine kinase, contains HisKA and HATPase domains [Niabella drilacis]|uniref:histidine kinase n=2 Tax=Niabella drilacis (strain DSM 25811 / CCM 8410 / CCUG 62505 / LMG 26954 / E90) TaxID=1285928 RepID=A0A1G6S6P4_NIADE|nr:Two-component sensor histidine kinase, contains HisKA and HATPase domains [Niabella drilacis]
MAQNPDIKRKIERIDSLMDKYYTNFEQAEREADELYNLLKTKYKSKEYKGFLIDVMLQKSILYSLNGEHYKALQIALKALDEAKEYELPEKIYRSCWIIEIMYENGGDYKLCRQYLDEAHKIYKKYSLDNVYSVYCIRMSSYYVRVQKRDSALHFAYRGLEYAQKYQNKREIRDAYLLLGGLLSENHYKDAVKYKSMAAKQLLELEDYASAASQLTSASRILIKHNQPDEAMKYSDSAFSVLRGTNAYINPEVYEVRSDLFRRKGKMDSAYYYFEKFHNVYANEQSKMENSKIKQISEQYQNDKKEAVIKSKNRQMVLTAGLLALIVFGSVVLFWKNREISRKNKVINKQLAELSKTLNQKQVLLSELQHRVKNNLQHVISILEIQKESVDFNNIDELIRGNQNRIHSMALLHKKLNVADNVNEVDLKRYVTELSELVKDSYDSHNKKVNLFVNVSIEKISLEKALPLGLIIVELVSNSMKHAFQKQNIGIISIELTKDSNSHTLYYSDNGGGFDFNAPSEKGLGQEIIKGLIDQLDGVTETKSDNGFELTVSF